MVIRLDELMNDMGDLKIPVFYGGPVQMDTIHFLHQYPEEIAGSYEIMNGIYWGGDFELAIDLLAERRNRSFTHPLLYRLLRLVGRTADPKNSIRNHG